VHLFERVLPPLTPAIDGERETLAPKRLDQEIGDRPLLRGPTDEIGVPVAMTTAVFGCARWTSLASQRPSCPGISTSITAMSQRCVRSVASASSALAAVCGRSPRAETHRDIRSRTAGSSSTINTEVSGVVIDASRRDAIALPRATTQIPVDHRATAAKPFASQVCYNAHCRTLRRP